MTEAESTSTATTSVDAQLLAGVPLIDIDELAPIVRTRLQPKIDRLGYLGGFFQLTAHQPESLAAFIDFTEAAKRALPDDLSEIVALTVATATGNDYERHQHERLSVKIGFTKQWVAAVERLNSHDADLSAPQRATQRWVLAVLAEHGRNTQPQAEAMVRELGHETAVAVALACGRYIAHATIANSFGIQPPVASIFAVTDER